MGLEAVKASTNTALGRTERLQGRYLEVDRRCSFSVVEIGKESKTNLHPRRHQEELRTKENN